MTDTTPTPETTETPTNTDTTPPWGDEENFDPSKAWALIQNLRKDKAQLQERLEANAPAPEPASKPETTPEPAPEPEPEPEATETDYQAENQALRAELAKTRALASTGIPLDMAIFLPNGTDEEIAAAAHKLLEFRNSPHPETSLPPTNPAQAATTPPLTKDDLARQGFSELGLN